MSFRLNRYSDSRPVTRTPDLISFGEISPATPIYNTRSLGLKDGHNALIQSLRKCMIHISSTGHLCQCSATMLPDKSGAVASAMVVTAAAFASVLA